MIAAARVALEATRMPFETIGVRVTQSAGVLVLEVFGRDGERPRPLTRHERAALLARAREVAPDRLRLEVRP